MAKRIYLDEIDYNDINSNPYFNPANYAKPQKINNNYKPTKTTKNSSVSSGEYAVKKGDSLWKIAQEHGTTVQALRDANPEIKGNMIYPNQIINLGNKSTTNNSTTQTNTFNQYQQPDVSNNVPLEYIRQDLFRRGLIRNRNNNSINYEEIKPQNTNTNELKPVVVKSTINKNKKKQIRLNNFNIQKEIRKRNLVYRIQDNM